MARFQIFKDGRLEKDWSVEPGTEYTVGRADDSDLVLEADRGISRQHLKVYHDGQGWIVEVLSRYGELYQGTQKVPRIQLRSGDRFSVPPYEFQFEDTSVRQNVKEIAPSSQEALESGMPVEDFSDRTFVGQMELVPYVTVCDQDGTVVQIFRLEGHSWVAGRDETCTLFIDNTKFSRRHFEIRNQDGAFMIQDLGSSNGTALNDEPIAVEEWTILRSGDVLKVVDWTLVFELRDSSFDARLQEVPQEIMAPAVYDPPYAQQPPTQYIPQQGQYPQANDNEYEPQYEVKKKPNFVRLLMGVILVGAIGYYVMGGTEKPQQVAEKAPSAIASPFDKLNPQQQQYVRDTYRLADRLFKEGRYEMSRQEIAKIHQLIPSYEESKNLEKLADVAIQTQIEQQKADAREKDKIEMEDKIQKTVAECRTKVNPNVEMRTIDDCLGTVVALNPDHPGIAMLKGQVDQIIADRVMKNEQKAEYQSLVRRHKSLYEKATGIQGRGDDMEAIKAYQVVVNSKLPDPEDLKGQAKRQIASIQQKMVSMQSSFEQSADAAAKRGDIKTAIKDLNKALLINPDNEVIKGRVNSMMSELKKQMQTLYQEGVLEESVGEVETAKGKWKKIIETSVPEEDYYKKAKSKLKKYGVE